MKRRKFIHISTHTALAMGLSLYSCSSEGKKSLSNEQSFEDLTSALLATWCEGMLATQINNPEEPSLHGALYCPACDKIHGRCMDAVYPFLYMADKTGDPKYTNAALNLMKWSENVSMPDGSWTVIPDPESWKGITVFGAIALGEAIHHHGHVLPPEIREEWLRRLEKATDFVFKKVVFHYSHINYAFTAIYGLAFLGRLLNSEKYIVRSREMAKEIPNWLTEPNKLVFGENKPDSEPSPKGLLPVDLGYNVEESLNGLVQYADIEQDKDLMQKLKEVLRGHLHFMLPDGAWDNSWGTRQNKWTYYGSRTTDGCQPAFSIMSQLDPIFGTAVFRNTELMERCTVEGLLAGGLHYGSHGVEPCVHHTFVHAKSLAFVLNNKDRLMKIKNNGQLPRSKAKGIRHFPEIDVWLISQGPWKSTVSSYDVLFKKPYSQAATGGSLAVLWHEKAGPIFTASMAEYVMVEVHNQQPQPDEEDVPLTPRIETTKEGQWFSNLFDLKAKVDVEEDRASSVLDIETQLTDRERKGLKDGIFGLRYTFTESSVAILARRKNDTPKDLEARLVLPIISPSGEKVSKISENLIEIIKDSVTLTIECNVPLFIMETKRDRVFNMVPGMQAVPIYASFKPDVDQISCTIKIM